MYEYYRGYTVCLIERCASHYVEIRTNITNIHFNSTRWFYNFIL